jgi:N utilization substance protein A
MKGSRVQAIIRELRGERIDIIEWSEDPAVFAANALSPAKVSKVEINSFEEKKLTVTVPEDQLSLAIGKKGQNVRLAAKLVGWHIDIRSAEEAARAAAAQLEAVMAGGEATLTDIRDSLALDQITAERLRHRDIETIDQLALISVDELVDAIDVSFDQANEILERAHRLLAQKHAREAREAREAEEAAVKAATEPEAGDDLAATAEGEETNAVAAAEQELLRPDTFEAQELGVEEGNEPGALPEREQAAEAAPVEEVAHAEAATETESDQHVVATAKDEQNGIEEAGQVTGAAEEHEAAVELSPEAAAEGSGTESGTETDAKPESAAGENEQDKKE